MFLLLIYMDKKELRNLFSSKSILTNKFTRKFNWESLWDNECEDAFDKFSANYRSPDEAWFCLLHNIEPPKCQLCGNIAKFTGRINKKKNYYGYNSVCENCSANKVPSKILICKASLKKKSNVEKEISNKKRKNTNKLRYGDENYGCYGSKSFHQNLKNKYGDEFYNNREKAKRTCLERYGVTCNLQLKEVQEKSQKTLKENHDKIQQKIKRTCLERYGVNHFNQSQEIKNKQKASLINKYGSWENSYIIRNFKGTITKLLKYDDPIYHNKDRGSNTIKQNHIKFENSNNCTKYGDLIDQYGQGWQSMNLPVIYNGRFRYIDNKYINDINKYSKENHNIGAVSKEENELCEFIKTITNYDVKRNIRIQHKDHKIELDIYIPDLHMAFEFNGMYWHSIKYKCKEYHRNKTKICYEKGIQLIHIYEYDWINNKDVIKQRIIKLLNNEDCTEYNWIPLDQYRYYYLGNPEKITYNGKYIIYNEGKFIKK